MKKLIKDMTYEEIDKEFAGATISEKLFIQLKKNKYISDWRYWGNGEWTLEIIKDNGNLYSDIDIFVRDEE